MPDLETLTVLPWDRRYAVAAADLEFDGKPYNHDSRAVLKRQIARAAEQGYVMNMGVEPELYVLREIEGEWLPFVASTTRSTCRPAATTWRRRYRPMPSWSRWSST